MIVAAVVLIGVAVGVFVLARGGGADGLDGEGAADGFAAVADDAEYDDTGRVELRRCPLGDPAELAERIVDVLDVSDEVLDGASNQFMLDRNADYPETFWCYQRAGESDALGALRIGFSVGELPRGDDYLESLEDILGAGGEVEDAEDYKGGTIYPFCNQPAGGTYGCGADWVDEEHDIQIGVTYSDDDAESEPAVAALKELLPDLLEALAAQA